MKAPRTRLETFMRTNGISAAALAKEAGVGKRELAGIISGEAVVDLDIMTAMRIRDACGRLAGRQSGIADVFDLD